MCPASSTSVAFFDEYLPQVLEKFARPKRTGDVIFEIAGFPGGRWRLRLGDPTTVTPVSSRVQGDLIIRMDERTFEDFLDEDLDLERAIDEGRAMLAGDLRLVDELAAMWQVPQSLLAFRASRGKR
jgi:hypothetical protein